jgi:type I restriction enzyme, S subunit
MATSGWTRVPLGDFVTLQRGHDLPDERRRPGNVPILGSFGITGWHDEARAPGPGVTVGRSGASFGVVSYSLCDYWPLNTALYVIDFHGNDPRFAYYFLRHFDFRGYNSGSAQPSLNRNFIHPVPVDVPPPEEQRAIAHILGTLDDKIELNRRMNETLEAMARALFKSWFVDFDPVRTKAEGRDPGRPKPLADLFPARLVDSELGEIPEGWDVSPLDSALVLQRGFDLPAPERTSGAYPVLAASGPSGTHNEFMVRGPGVTTGRSGVLGKVFYVAEDFWPLNTSLWVKEFRHSRPAYAFHLLQGQNFALFNAGSAVPTLNRNHVHTLPTLLPPMKLIDAFERFATGCLTRQKSNGQEATTLAKVRDALLSKLISGELRVKDAKKLIARAA